MRKRTGGGRWDPEDRTAYFVAGNLDKLFAIPHRWSLLATNDLMSKSENFGYPVEARLQQPEHLLLLDSGIFWLTNQHKRQHPGMTMDEALALAPDEIDGFDKLWTAYLHLLELFETDLWGYVELDQGGAENKRKTRAKLEGLGYTPIPVYHPLNDGWDYFDELCEGYDRICFGNVVQANFDTRRALLHTMWERKRKYPEVWVHLLGVTPDILCSIYSPSSTDSATFCYSLKFGANHTPFSMSMLDRFSHLESKYSYVPGVIVEPGGRDDGMKFLATHATFMVKTWRAQQQRLRELFGDDALSPPRDDREPELMPASAR